MGTAVLEKGTGRKLGDDVTACETEETVVKPKPVVWELVSALDLVRELQWQVTRFDYHIAIGGGVINKGQSFKDLDLYFLPMGKSSPHKLTAFLDKQWGVHVEVNEDYPETSKFVYIRYDPIIANRPRRIDVFIL